MEQQPRKVRSLIWEKMEHWIFIVEALRILLPIFILIKEKILDVSRVYLQAFDRLDCFTPSNVRESRRVFARTTISAKFEMPPLQHFADIGEFGSTGPRNFASYNYKEGSQLAGKMKNAGEEMAANSRLMAAPWRAHGQTSGP